MPSIEDAKNVVDQVLDRFRRLSRRFLGGLRAFLRLLERRETRIVVSRAGAERE